MKKIPTLFKRIYDADGNVVGVSEEVTPGMEWVLSNDPNIDSGTATIKLDGACCALIKGVFYKRYDAKNGKKPPTGAIACCEPDSVTGHWPHWVKVSFENPSDKWFVEALNSGITKIWYGDTPSDGTYEAVGPHFQGNPYKLDYDCLVRHGIYKEEVERTYDGIKNFLRNNVVEGIVFWKNGEPQCKIKRKNFGFVWPPKEKDIKFIEEEIIANESSASII